jgi:type I restriction enzyme S subunit
LPATLIDTSHKSHYKKLPSGWEWARLWQVIQIINGDRGKNYPSEEKLTKVGIPFVSASNIFNGVVAEDELL